MFCAGQRARIQDSLGGGCVFLLRDDHFRSLRGPGFDPHSLPQFGKGPRYFLGDALLFQDALSLFHPFVSEFTDYRGVPFQRQIFLLRVGSLFFQRSPQLSIFFLALFCCRIIKFYGALVLMDLKLFGVRDSRAT